MSALQDNTDTRQLNIDTLGYYKYLKDAGVESRQAEAHAHLLSSFAETQTRYLKGVIESSLEGVATKEELSALRLELKEENAVLRLDMATLRTDMAEFRTEIKGEVAGVRLEVKESLNTMLKWMLTMFVGFFVGLAGLLFTALNFFSKT